MPKRQLARLAAALAASGLLQVSTGAAPVGNLDQFRPLSAAEAGTEAPTGWALTTDAKVRIRIGLLRDDVLRIQAEPAAAVSSADKAASGAPAADLHAPQAAAPIVLPAVRPTVPAQVEQHPDHVLIRTAALALRIYRRPLRFELDRVGADGGQQPMWRELQPLELGREASVQTLSSSGGEQFFGGGQQNGRYAFKGRELEVSYSGGWDEGDRPSPAPFLLSSRGWAMLRNTWSDGSYDLRQDDRALLLHKEKRFDAYYFVGPTLREALDRYTELTGRARLLPRWAFEYGDADCYNDGDNGKKPGTVPAGWRDGPAGTTPDVIETVARKYREHDMPGGWILPNDGYGCGYAELPQVVKGLRQYGFRTGLWTENGVDKIAWEVGQAGSRVQKLDVAWTGQGYQFAMDANQAAYDGILNNSDSRPFVWTVMGWAGIQRYAVAWLGDQHASWDYIRWQIPTLIGSGLSGQAYAAGDVDAIFGGSAETYVRDLQWKTFTPVLMGMSGWSATTRKHPWWFDEPYRSINRRYLKLKLRLTPYMYGLAREAELHGAPPVRGLMWDYPQDPAAYGETYKDQFLLGRELLVAPVYRSQAASRGWRRDIHLPEGRWYDYWDGREVEAGRDGRRIDLAVTLDKLPLFVRAGAILPMYPEVLYDGEKPKDTLTLDLYPHGDSDYTLYEDDGDSRRYQGGEFSEQRIRMQAPPAGQAGTVRVAIEPVRGRYAGQEAVRRYALQVHSHARPGAVALDGQPLPQLADRAAFEAAGHGWFYDPSDRLGTLWAKSAPTDIRQALTFGIELTESSAQTRSSDFPAAPDEGRAIPADAIQVVGRPAEEPGHALEGALDDAPASWFRTMRDQTRRSGPHEWVLNLGERRLIDGIELAPRTDDHWRYGQVRDYEVYLGDNNGDWAAPVARGRLALAQGPQTIAFKPAAGRLLRFRVLTVHDPDAADAAAADAPPAAYSALEPAAVAPIVLSTFHVLEHRPAPRPELQRALSDLARLPAGIHRDRPAAAGADGMRMNGLAFRKGIGMGAQGRLDLALAGDWQRLRADLGIDDRCRAAGGLRFQIWGDGRLLYDSGQVEGAAVVKPELDIRGLSRLSLRTLGARGAQPAQVCGNWANAALLGLAGAEAGVVHGPSPAKAR